MKQKSNKEMNILYISKKALGKMFALVDLCPKEIQWHGKVTRQGSRYYLRDIFMFPQYVSGAEVTTDDTEYWRYICKDVSEKMKPITMHGHSHVNFSVNRSYRDVRYQRGIISGLDKDEFYLFLIINKSHEINVYGWDNARNEEILPSNTTIIVEAFFVKMPVHGYKSWANKQIKQFVRPISQYVDKTEVLSEKELPKLPAAEAGMLENCDEEGPDDDWLHWEQFSLNDPFARNEV